MGPAGTRRYRGFAVRNGYSMGGQITPAGAPHRSTPSIDFWRVDDVIVAKQLGGPRGGTLEAAIAATDAIEHLVDGERLPMLFDARTVGWMDADARAYSRGRIGNYLTRVAVLVSWEKRRAHEYAFKDVHRETGVEVGVFTDRQAALEFLATPAVAL